MLVSEYPEYLIGKCPPNVINTFEIQRYLPKLIKPREYSLGLRSRHQLLIWISPELDRNMGFSKSKVVSLKFIKYPSPCLFRIG